MRGKIFVLTGPSGSGKTTILKRLIEKPELNLQRVVTCTTREKREGEVGGKDYFFLSKDEFNKSLENNEFFEYAEVYGNYYGSRKNDVEKILNSGKNVIFQVDPQGAENMKEIDPSCIVIFIKAESIDELKNRLLARNQDSDTDLEKRLGAAQKEIDESAQFDYVLVNETGKIGEAVREVEKIIKSQSLNN